MILCLSIPYDEGWTAYVDGKKPILCRLIPPGWRLNFRGGEHDIELRYWTPGLTTGICLTVFGIIAMVWYLLRREKGKMLNAK